MEQIKFYVIYSQCNLLELQANDPAWFVKPLIDDISNQLIGIFWISPEQRERWSNFYDIIIHNNTARTNKYNYLLSLFILIENYNKSRLAAQAFLQDERQESYECVFEQRSQAGTQSTQCVESENALIQKAVQSSFSLLQVQESFKNRLKFESINNRYSIWKTLTLQYIQPFVIQTFFSGIDNIMKKYLTQPIHDVYYKQMCQSVCYQMDDSNETLIKVDHKDQELNLKSLISLVDSNDILEI
ncbi:hypothetical protein C1646_749110 [Rhizophagus diaphanus]|nr:hypothetical protein C1646_749110 [Rhizophagus diaphanus] [Rhizophagus sp. MUCL 43196]